MAMNMEPLLMGVAFVLLVALGYFTVTFLAIVRLTALKRSVEEVLVQEPKIHDLPNGKGGIALDAIAAVQHEGDGVNTWVYLKAGHGAALCLTWADGVELEQAWRAWAKR
jgi:hypothetical protein